VEEGSETIRLGRYGICCPLVLERLAWDDTSGEFVYRARRGHHDSRGESVARWDVLESFARVLDHLPEPGQQLLRYWGGYSNAARRRRQHQQAAASAVPRTVTDPADAEGRLRRLTWSQLIRMVYEIDPLL
jgi:Putative transposase